MMNTEKEGESEEERWGRRDMYDKLSGSYENVMFRGGAKRLERI